MSTIKANRPHRSRHLTWIGHCSILDANNNAVVQYAISSSLRIPLNDDGNLRETHRSALGCAPISPSKCIHLCRDTPVYVCVYPFNHFPDHLRAFKREIDSCAARLCDLYLTLSSCCAQQASRVLNF